MDQSPHPSPGLKQMLAGKPPAPAFPPTVYIGIPTYPGGMIHHGTASGLINSMRTTRTIVQFIAGSFTSHSFNTLWSSALNARDAKGSACPTHFLMFHVDIIPLQVDWLPRMIALMAEHKAEILSVVSPIKSGDGYTSTAWETGPNQVRRYTMQEIMAFEDKTFTRPNLLLNNGLMLVDLSAPWVDKVKFEMINRIERDETGQRSAVGMPEDWYFSRAARLEGAKLFATSEIQIEHIGNNQFPNYSNWGSAAHDPGIPLPLDYDTRPEHMEVVYDAQPTGDPARENGVRP